MEAIYKTDKERQKRIEEIKTLICRHAVLSSEGNAQAANEVFRQYTQLICIDMQENQGFSLAEILLASDEPVHRYVGAYYLLPFKPRRAAYALFRLFAVKQYFVGMHAKTLYHEWRRKRLRFPVVDVNSQLISYVDQKEFRSEMR